MCFKGRLKKCIWFRCCLYATQKSLLEVIVLSSLTCWPLLEPSTSLPSCPGGLPDATVKGPSGLLCAHVLATHIDHPWPREGGNDGSTFLQVSLEAHFAGLQEVGAPVALCTGYHSYSFFCGFSLPALFHSFCLSPLLPGVTSQIPVWKLLSHALLLMVRLRRYH